MKKNIWILNHYSGGMLFDKGGRHYNIAKFLKKHGYEPVIFCSNTKHRVTGRYYEIDKLWEMHTAEDINVPFVFVDARVYSCNGKQRVLNMVDFYRNVQKAAKEYAQIHGKPDVILASSVHPLTIVAGIKIAKKFKIPCICEIRDLWPEAIFTYGKAKENSILGKTLVAGEHWIYKKADALIFTKEGDTDYLKEHKWTTAQGGNVDLGKCYYINNGVDLDVFYEQQKTHALTDPDLEESGKFNVVYTGAIRPVNNVGNIVDCAAILKNEHPEVQFLIYGAGSELEALQERVKAENLTNVKFKGNVEKKYIPFVLSRSSCNLLNYSQTEYNWSRGNSSNKLFEYMASGKPIISTVRMGYSIINHYHCGVELDECTPKCLADAIVSIKEMTGQEYDQMSANARNGAKDFDFKALTVRLENVVKTIFEE